MATKKRRETIRKKSKPSKSKPKKKAAVRKKASSRATKSSLRKTSSKKPRPAARKKRTSRSSTKEVRSPEPSTLSGEVFPVVKRPRRGATPSAAAGQSGDIQALSRRSVADSESVEELVEEGQAREAAAISGVEDASGHDEREVHTHELPEDDVPEEYTDED